MTEVLSRATNVAVIVFAITSMLAVGFAHTVREVLVPLRNLRAVGRALLANFVAVPLVALLTIRLLPLDQPHAVGLFLISAAAGAPFLIHLTATAKSDVALSTTLLILLLPTTIVYMPIVVPLTLPAASVNPLAIAAPLVLTMLLPLAAGLVARALSIRWAARLRPGLSTLSIVSLVVLVLATILANVRGILDVVLTFSIVAALLVIGGGFVIGYLLGGPTREAREVLGLGTSQRNIAAATVVATQTVGDPDTVVMVIVSSLVGFAVLFPVAAHLRGHPEVER